MKICVGSLCSRQAIAGSVVSSMLRPFAVSETSLLPRVVWQAVERLHRHLS
jgi:hypothetical protein